MTTTLPTCKSCRFYLDVAVNPGQPESGKCRRFPPVRVAPSMSSYAPVPADSWCGEWSASPVETAALVAPPLSPPLESTAPVRVPKKPFKTETTELKEVE